MNKSDDYVCSVPAEHDGCKMYTNALNTVAMLDDPDDYKWFVDVHELKFYYNRQQYYDTKRYVDQWPKLVQLIIHTTHREPDEIYCASDKILVARYIKENQCYLIAPQVQREVIDYE